MQVWLTVKNPNLWSTNQGENLEFIRQMAEEVRTEKTFVGIQTSKSDWESITGGTTLFRNLLLWYTGWDNKANFENFEPFGGWKVPAVKQFSDTTELCGISVNKNWDPLEKTIWRLSPGVWSRIGVQ